MTASKFRQIYAIAAALLMTVCAGCSQRRAEVTDGGNGVYYWRTTFNLSENEKRFLKEHDISKLYLRLFDVTYDFDFDDNRMPVPNATLQFETTLPDSIEIIPVIYITQDAINNGLDSMAATLYGRIKSMAEANRFGNFREVQLDCDWTKTSKPAYFRLCSEMGKLLHADNREISSTIRLHQLRDDAPPVDKGVLMIYNTGSIYDAECDNSIIGMKEVKPYLKSKTDYPLPLKTAFSTYGWSRVFDNNNQFVCLLHTTEFKDTCLYSMIAPDRYRVNKFTEIENKYLYEGYTIICEHSPAEVLTEVKGLVYDKITSEINGNILYHLDEKSLNDYTANQINEILNPGR